MLRKGEAVPQDRSRRPRRLLEIAEPDLGVRRGRGRPPNTKT